MSCIHVRPFPATFCVVAKPFWKSAMYLPLFFLVTVATASNPNIEPCTSHNPGLPAYHLDLFREPSPLFTASNPAPQVAYGGTGLSLSIHQRFDNPQVYSLGYLLYGKAEATIRSLGAAGIISLFYLQSDDLDEIDIAEITGSYSDVYMSNFFVKGNTSNHDRGDYHPILNPHDNNHRYGVEWTPQEITWMVDGSVVRRLSRENVHGFPVSPMRVYLSVWAGGDPDNNPGTIWWAGGETSYDKVPYTMNVQDLLIMNYSPGKLYVYGNGVELHSVAASPPEMRDIEPKFNPENSEGNEHVKRSNGSVLRRLSDPALWFWWLAVVVVGSISPV